MRVHGERRADSICTVRGAASERSGLGLRGWQDGELVAVATTLLKSDILKSEAQRNPAVVRIPELRHKTLAATSRARVCRGRMPSSRLNVLSTQTVAIGCEGVTAATTSIKLFVVKMTSSRVLWCTLSSRRECRELVMEYLIPECQRVKRGTEKTLAQRVYVETH